MFFEDRMELLSRLETKSIDVAILDPEYGINALDMSMGSNPKRKGANEYPSESTAKKVKGRLNSGGGKLKNRLLNKSEIDWDNAIPTPEFWNEIFRVSKNQIIFGGNYFPELWEKGARGIGFWDKLQPWENFSQFELIWTSYDCPAFKIAYSNTGGANKETKIHPTQKPVPVYKHLLKKFIKPDDIILDTGHGSGSSIIACHDFGNKIIACDNSPLHFNDSLIRVQDHVSHHQSLFEPAELLQSSLSFDFEHEV